MRRAISASSSSRSRVTKNRRVSRKEYKAPALRRSRFTPFVDSRQEIVETRMEAARERPFSCNDVQPFQTGELREQIEINRPEAVRVGRPIGDGHDDLAVRAAIGAVQRETTERVLVEPAHVASALFW